ncbi:transglutaminase TgpA family protein [Halorussus amylolyticus]|uniref:transglutaminase TgpA family protein n=1 Tax=Halorussus amylolyticus TaxID=1126242 RepID=UPI0010499E8D|nr:transglutaminaseTgpA domain-containing protein [Halorussus amylolyticus]
MSAESAVGRELELGDVSVPYHWLAVGSTTVLIATYLSVLFHVTDVVGGTTALLALVAATLLAGAGVARHLRAGQAAALAVGLLAVGVVAYYLTVPSAYLATTTVRKVVGDNVALLTGLSVLRMTEVGAWALGVAPGLVFGPWYLVLRRRYALAVAAGGAALGFFVLTGDAGSFVTLVGSLAAAAALGFGTLARRGGTPAQVDTIAVVLVAMILLASTVSVVPGGSASPVLPGGGGGTPTVEGSLVSNDDRANVVGSIRLSPKVRFTVESDESAYWRVGAYDRYDGDGWIRTGDTTDYRAQESPPGETTEVSQTVTVEAERLDAMPAAWRPTRLTDGDRSNTRITSAGSFDPVGSLRQGERYSVTSSVPDATERELQTAGTDYPDEVESRYLQLPESSGERIQERTDEITADAETPYEQAVAVEDWLESEKDYSLDVERPDGDIAESFIFDMEAGYCTYYATAMVAMLRSQDVPARFAVGYTPGQRVAEDEWVVRGLDSHAWVEAYFPEVGWVRFDPTPGDPRQTTESAELTQARASNVSDVDTDESEGGTWTPTTTESPTDEGATTTETNETNETSGATEPETGAEGPRRQTPDVRDGVNETVGGSATDEDATAAGASGDGGGLGITVEPPSREQTALGAVVAVGLVAAARRTGVIARLRRVVWLHWQPRSDPETDVSQAFDRLEHVLSREHRERRPGETPRAYLGSLADGDDRIERVGRLYERVRYAGETDERLADEAVSLVDELVRERRGAT